VDAGVRQCKNLHRPACRPARGAFCSQPESHTLRGRPRFAGAAFGLALRALGAALGLAGAATAAFSAVV